MYRLIPLLILVAGVLIALLRILIGAVERGPVTRARLVAFARRHQLVITVDNGNRVIHYLATTRRWRAVGLATGLATSVGWALRHDAVRVDFLSLFAGWFVGALIAEVRLARTSFGPRRAASLVPRAPVRYLPRTAWALVPGAAAVSTGIAIATAIAVLRGHSVDVAAALLWVLAVAVSAVVGLVQLRVLRRPQSVDAPDLLAAEDAIRSRSLHVLAGGGMTLVLYCAIGQLVQLNPADLSPTAQAIEVVSFLGYLGVPVAGWLVALARWPVGQPGGPVGGPARSVPADGQP